MHLNDIHLLYEYNYWANHLLLGVAATLSHEQFTKNLSSSHGGIHGTLVHMMGGEEIWLKRWKGNSPSSIRKPEEFPTFSEVSSHWDTIEHEMMEFCHTLKTDEDIGKILMYKDIKGNQYSQPLWQMMQHLANHSTYHRGQVVTMLRQLSVKPIGTDLITFYREKGKIKR